jgi:leader peptidase (prepilin peptidase)/N-methyltransferase
VELPDWFWITFTFAFGCCVGSFLNVVIYRLPREKSLVKPPSACPACGKHIRFYDNIPLISYILLGRKCRYCKAPISPRYFVIELLTGLVFVFMYYLLFKTHLRNEFPEFLSGGWLIYLVTIILLSGLIASSAIDLELWIIPLWVCWVITIVGIVGSALAPLLIDYKQIRGYHLLPYASADSAALALGAAIGLGVSMLLLVTGLLKKSYDFADDDGSETNPSSLNNSSAQASPSSSNIGSAQASPKTKGEIKNPASSIEYPESSINHRIEVLRELLFLTPIIASAIIVFLLTKKVEPIRGFWLSFSERPVVAGLFGSIFAYFIGCGIVWAARILGTLSFGKEAMGLGDVHLMGAAGSCIGAVPVTAAFFAAPFFGLAWAVVQMFFKKTRQIPYGPFLSIGIFIAIIASDRIWGYVAWLRA